MTFPAGIHLVQKEGPREIKAEGGATWELKKMNRDGKRMGE